VSVNPAKIIIGAKDETAGAFRSVETGLKGIEKTAGGVGKLLANLAGPLSVAGLVMVGKAALDSGDQIKTLSDKLGVGAVALSQYRYIAGQTGTDFETLGKGLKFSMKAVSEAANGNDSLAARFNDIGLSVKQLRALNPQDAFEKIGAAIAELPNESDRAAFAMAIFGKAGADLIPVFAGGAGALAAMRAESDRLGLTLTDEAAAACDSANDAATALQQTLSAAATTIMVEVAPALTEAAIALQPVAKGLGTLAGFFKLFQRPNKVAFLGGITETSAAYKEWLEIYYSKGPEAGDDFITRYNVGVQAARDRTWQLVTGTQAYTVSAGGAEKATAAQTLELRRLAAATADGVSEAQKAAADADKAAQKTAAAAAAKAAESKAADDLAASLARLAVARELADFQTRIAGDQETAAQRAGGKRASEVQALDETRAAAAAAEAALHKTKTAADTAFSTAENAARAAADTIADSFTAAVFDSKRKLIDLRSIAGSIFGMLMSYGVRYAIGALIPGLAPAMGFAKSAGPVAAAPAPGLKSAGPVGPAPAAGSAGPVSLTVNVSGVVDVTNPLSVRRLATAIQAELDAVAKFHGPTGSVA
jgi:hypothetical protein